MDKLDKPNKPNKLKIIPPTMRENRRYLLLSMQDQNKVQKAIFQFIGELGWAKSGPIFVWSKKGLILSINAKSLDEIRTSLELSNIHVVKLSGTINKLKN